RCSEGGAAPPTQRGANPPARGTHDERAVRQRRGGPAAAPEAEVLAPPRPAGTVEAEDEVWCHRVGEEELPLVLLERPPPGESPGPISHPEGSEVGHPRTDVPACQGRVPRRLFPLVHRLLDEV